LDDLDQNLILNIIHKSIKEKRLAEVAMRENIPTVLEKLKLIEDGNIKNAAVALFGKKFLPNYPQCQLKMARFKGIDRHEFLDNERLYGNIFEFLERAILFVNRHLPVAAKVVPGQLERVENPFTLIKQNILCLLTIVLLIINSIVMCLKISCLFL
jgi:ATP-dependent DNA helicase RecG